MSASSLGLRAALAAAGGALLPGAALLGLHLSDPPRSRGHGGGFEGLGWVLAAMALYAAAVLLAPFVLRARGALEGAGLAVGVALGGTASAALAALAAGERARLGGGGPGEQVLWLSAWFSAHALVGAGLGALAARVLGLAVEAAPRTTHDLGKAGLVLWALGAAGFATGGVVLLLVVTGWTQPKPITWAILALPYLATVAGAAAHLRPRLASGARAARFGALFGAGPAAVFVAWWLIEARPSRAAELLPPLFVGVIAPSVGAALAWATGRPAAQA